MSRIVSIFLIASFLLLLSEGIFAQQKKEWLTRFEQTQGQETVTYQEGIAYLEKLAQAYPEIQLMTYGTTDSGFPLHLVVFSEDKNFNPKDLQAQEKLIFMVNNAIHPGEPDGVDATLMLLRDIAQKKELKKLLKNTVLIAIPFYNIGGVLNRNTNSRANQNGPLSYGFRGNARNLDLNRDFIKADSKNALAFMEIFQTWQPDVFLDNHVSNGADYQYVMTYLATQPDKLGGDMGKYLRKDFIPNLNQKMTDKKQAMTPYVNVFGRTPEPEGFAGFYDSPRYTSGYTTLFHTLGFISETHMLKPYPARVEATYQLMQSFLEILDTEGKQIKALRKAQAQATIEQNSFALDWKVRRDTSSTLLFRGYEAEKIPSKVTTGDRLKYYTDRPFTKEIPFYEFYQPTLIVEKPIAYIIPQAWQEIIDLLKRNGVQMKRLSQDQNLDLEAYHITDFKTRAQPYESHYGHYQTEVEKSSQTISLRKGDYVVFTNQVSNRYIIETLEPQAIDSFFNWNFFDSILQQKEGYSSYVFEDIAEELLKNDASLREKFNQKLKEDEEFAKDADSQLYFIYQNSPYSEKEYNRYPIFRLEKKSKILLGE
jgi:hypothetical protein